MWSCGGRKKEGSPQRAQRHRTGLNQCNSCREQFTVRVGTVFERSKIPLSQIGLRRSFGPLFDTVSTARSKCSQASGFNSISLSVAMARQPFKLYRDRVASGQITIGPQVIGSRPALESLIGKCLMLWPNAETEMGLILAQLLGTPSPAVIAVYQSLRRFTNQFNAIMTAAEHTLKDEEDQELLAAVFDVHKSIEAERNALAHGHFGIHNNMPDAILWLSTENYVAFKAKHHVAKIEITRMGMGDLISSLFVYKEKDIQSIYSDISMLCAIWVDTMNWLQAKPSLRDILCRQLSSQSRISAALDIRRRRNTREAQFNRLY